MGDLTSSNCKIQEQKDGEIEYDVSLQNWSNFEGFGVLGFLIAGGGFLFYTFFFNIIIC